MTNNQREFQKEVNRIQRELAQLQQTHHFKHIAPIPEQPKHITRKHLEQIKSLKGRNLIQDTELKHPRTKKPDEPHKKRRKNGETYDPYIGKGYRDTRSDKGTKRDEPSPLKGRPSPLKGRPSPLKGRPSPLKGKKRGALTPEERDRRNAKRKETIAKKYPTFSPAEAIIDRLTHANMVAKLEDGINDLNTVIDIAEQAPRISQKKIDYLESARQTRTGYFQTLITLVEYNSSSVDYNKLLEARADDIERCISGIIYGSFDIAPNGQAELFYTELYTLLSFTEPTVEEKKSIAEAEEWIDTNLDWSDITNA